MGRSEGGLELSMAGTAGACEGCSRPIGRARLEAIWSAALCVACQAVHEAGDPDFERIPVADWDRVEAYEKAEACEMDVAIDRGQKIA